MSSEMKEACEINIVIIKLYAFAIINKGQPPQSG